MGDPRRSADLLHGLLADETAVFMDEVEVHTNPKVGSMWMTRGEQAAVDTPGDNEKRVLAGSLHWRTGRLFETWDGEKEGRPGCSAGTWTTCGGRSGTTG